MRTRLTATIALAALIFSAFLAIGTSNAGAQDQIERIDIVEEEETVLVCKLDGIDWVLYEMDVLTADYWLANGGQLAGADGCLVRVCQEKVGDYFTYWTTRYVSSGDAGWFIDQGAYLADPGVACPGNEPVTICFHAEDGDYIQTLAPDAADWLLFTGQASLLVDGACPVPEPEPTPDPEPTPEPSPEPEPTPEPEDEPTPTPEPEEEPEEETVPPTPEEEDEDDEETATKPDAEVKGSQEVRELAFTGAESSDLALYGGLILAAGIGLVAVSRRRMSTITEG